MPTRVSNKLLSKNEKCQVHLGSFWVRLLFIGFNSRIQVNYASKLIHVIGKKSGQHVSTLDSLRHRKRNVMNPASEFYCRRFPLHQNDIKLS